MPISNITRQRFVNVHLLRATAFSFAITCLPLSAKADQVGPAGCGLGSVIWGKDSQVLAASSNMTGTQTLGILFGTSNCAPKTKDSAVIEFVQTNKVALETDAARGGGETVKALSHLLGCSNSEALGYALKENYSDIFQAKKADAKEISAEIKETVEKSRTLSRSCARK